MNLEVLEATKKLVRSIHKDQVDKAGAPYTCHLSYVAAYVAHLGPEYECVAWAHDSIEDHSDKVSYDDFRAIGWNENMIFALECITKKKKGKWREHYPTYLDRVLMTDISTEVKLGDLEHNRDLTRFEEPGEKDFDRKIKYDDAVIYLCMSKANRIIRKKCS